MQFIVNYFQYTGRMHEMTPQIQFACYSFWRTLTSISLHCEESVQTTRKVLCVCATLETCWLKTLKEDIPSKDRSSQQLREATGRHESASV